MGPTETRLAVELAKGMLVAGTGKKWLLGCGLGCGVTILLLIILMVGGSMVMMKPFDRAVDAQKDLIEAFGERENYVPAADGLNAKQVEKFLAVRRQLVPMCEEFAAVGETFQRLEEIDEAGEEPSRGEVFSAVGDMMGAAFSIAGNIGRFTEARNEALLAEGMGLGEYIWIYVLAYNSWLQYEPTTEFGEDDNDGQYSAKDRQIIRQLMSNHAEALAAAGQAAESEVWLAEAESLERRADTGIPWRDKEMPANLTEVLELYEAELEQLYCAASSDFEFSQMRKRGLSITSD